MRTLILSILLFMTSALRLEAQDMANVGRLMRLQRFDSAAAAARAVIAADSSNGRAWSMLGTALLSSGQLQDAQTANRRAMQFEDTRATAMYNYGAGFARLGVADSAFVWLQQAKATGAINFADIDLDTDLASLRGDPRYSALKPSRAELSAPFVESATILHEWHGEAVNDQFGWVARDIGDVDGDHADDFVTSAPFAAVDGVPSGKVYVYSGRTGRQLWAAVGPKGSRLGIAAEKAGDVDGDGVPDVVAGAPGASRIFVYSGRDGRVLLDVQHGTPADNFGRRAIGIGDYDGDGRGDILVGAPAADAGVGAAYVLSGKDGSVLLELKGSEPQGQFGSGLSGYAHAGKTLLAISAPFAGPRHAGRLYLFKNRETTPSFVFDGDSTASAIGNLFVSVPGDLDRDGINDVFVSDFQDHVHGPMTGRVYVLSGANGKPILDITGQHAGDGFGTSSSQAGDVDGDGVPDLLVGAWQEHSNAINGGRIYLISGKTGSVLRTISGNVPGETLGFDAVGIRDAAGRINFLVTSAWSSVNGSRSGRVYIVRGS